MRTIRIFIRTNERYVDMEGSAVVLTDVNVATTNASVLDEVGKVAAQIVGVDGWCFLDSVVSERVQDARRG